MLDNGEIVKMEFAFTHKLREKVRIFIVVWPLVKIPGSDTILDLPQYSFESLKNQRIIGLLEVTAESPYLVNGTQEHRGQNQLRAHKRLGCLDEAEGSMVGGEIVLHCEWKISSM